jgi:hypothetical protein
MSKARDAYTEAERRLIIARRELNLFKQRRNPRDPGYSEMLRQHMVNEARALDDLAHAERARAKAEPLLP